MNFPKKTILSFMLIGLFSLLHGQYAPVFKPLFSQPPTADIHFTLNMNNRCLYNVPYTFNIKVRSGLPGLQYRYNLWNGTTWDTTAYIQHNGKVSAEAIRWNNRLFLAGKFKYVNGTQAPIGKLFTLIEFTNGTWQVFQGGTMDSLFATRNLKILANKNGLYLANEYTPSYAGRVYKYDVQKESFQELCTYRRNIYGMQITATPNRVLIANVKELNSQATKGFGYIDSSGIHTISSTHFNPELTYGMDQLTEDIYAVEKKVNPKVAIWTDTGVKVYNTGLNRRLDNGDVQVLGGRIIGVNYSNGTYFNILCAGETQWKVLGPFAEAPMLSQSGIFTLQKGVVLAQSQGILIKGKVFLDKDKNCAFSKSQDRALRYRHIRAKGKQLISSTLSDLNGDYELVAGYESYELEVDKAEYSCGPIHINTLSDGQEFKTDIAIVPNPEHDIQAQLIASRLVRWNGLARYRIKLSNHGAFADTVFYAFQIDPKLKIIQLDTSVSHVKDNKCHGFITDLPQLESVYLDFKVEIDRNTTDRDTVLCHEVFASPEFVDIDTTDNRDRKYQLVSYSYDPNRMEVDKALIPYAKKTTLTYRIDFQNLGNADAIDVRIVNPMPNVDWTDLKILHSSHPYQFVYEDDSSIFRFNGIYLKAKSENEELSKGYITYQITAPANLDYDQKFSNKAHIYFDLNAPITTNKAETQVDSKPTSVFMTKKAVSPLSFYPNPSREVLHISNIKEACQVDIYNAQGKLMHTHAIDTQGVIHLSTTAWNPGVYFVRSKYGVVRILKMTP